MKLSASTVKARLVIICILLGTIPAIIVGGFSTYRGSKSVQDKVNEGNMRNLVQVRMSVEQLLYTADHILAQFVETPAVKSSLHVELQGENFYIFNTVEDAINNLPTYSLGASEICFVNLEKNWVIDNSGIYRLEDYQDKSFLEELVRKPGTSFWIGDLSIGLGNTGDESSGECVWLVKKWPFFTEKPSCMAIMKIPYGQFSNLISENIELGKVMVISADGLVIAHNDKEEVGKDYNDVVYYRKAREQAGDQGRFTIEMDNVKYSINYLKSSYNNWLYLSITSIAEISKDSRAIVWFTFIACLTVIVVVNVAAFFISDRFYKPIQKLYNMVVKVPDRKDPAGRNRDEFSLIEERLNFLMKDNYRLNKQLSIQSDQLKEYFILQLILRDLDRDFIESRIKLYGFPVLTEPVCVLVARIDTFEGTIYQKEDMDLMLFAVNNIVGEILESIIVLKPIVVEEYQVTIIKVSNDTGNMKEIAFSATEKIQDTVKKTLNLSVSIGISDPVTGYGDISKAYYECIEALKHQISLGYGAIIFYHDIRNSSSLKPVFPEKLEEELLNAVKSCSSDKAKELLHQFIDRIFMVEASRHEYQTSLVRLLTDLLQILKDNGQSYDVVVKDGISPYEQLFALKTAGEIERWFFEEIIVPVIGNIEQSDKNQYKKIVEQVLNIIHEEFHTELTLEDCAARLNYHPSYIRRILKNEAGIVFSEYLAQYRIDMAKKWLIETDMKISDIAEKLKYKNAENFIRFFKKYTGMTPGKYRELNK
jgi:two-component system response regulator YesN